MRDQQDCPARHPGGSRGDGHGPVLLGQTVQDPLGDYQFLPLGPDLMQLIGQLLSERVQFTPASRDPLQFLHPHALSALSRRTGPVTDRKSRMAGGAAEPDNASGRQVRRSSPWTPANDQHE